MISREWINFRIISSDHMILDLSYIQFWLEMWLTIDKTPVLFVKGKKYEQMEILFSEILVKNIEKTENSLFARVTSLIEQTECRMNYGIFQGFMFRYSNILNYIYFKEYNESALKYNQISEHLKRRIEIRQNSQVI